MSSLSEQLIELVAKAASGVASVRGASAVAITDDLLATTDHTLRNEERITVLHSGDRKAAGELVGRVPGLDIAFLRVEGGGLTPLPAPAPARVGAMIAVVGFTADVGPSASLGIIGAVGGARRTWRGGALDQFIRLDVNVYPSQSGGAVVDVDGGLVGLATRALLRHSASAVPYATLQRAAGELTRVGRIRQGYLGVGLQSVTVPPTLRERAGIANEAGLMLLSLEPDGPADKAGLQLGDILVSVGSTNTGDPDELRDALRGDVVDQITEAVVIRGGQVIRVPVRVEERRSSRRREG